MMPSIAEINNLGGHAHNPRGNLWFNDESTYGHKLLTKMGWNKGKGLGKNEDGIKENLKVKYRSTNSGLGFKDDAYANVMKTEYESILKSLSAEYSCPVKSSLNKKSVNSDEDPIQKSKVVKSKLRYPKLFFGKDVTKYSEKDMKSVFICSIPLKNIEEKSEKAIVVNNEDVEIKTPQTNGTYSSSLSISDYFAKKMEEKKYSTLNNTSNNSCTNHQQAKNSENPILTTNESIKSKKKKKDSQMKIEKESANIDKLNEAAEEIVETENISSSNKKSRKRKKEPGVIIEDTEINLLEVKPCTSDNTKEEVLENSSCNNIIYSNTGETIPIQYSDKPKKKRKISQVIQNDSAESSKYTFHCEIQPSLPGTKHKKHKSKKYSETVLSSSENPMHENDITSIQNGDETNDQLLLETVENGLSDNTDCSKKKKKSKRKLKDRLKSCLKSKRKSYSLKNVSFNESVSYKVIDTEIESICPLVCNKNLDEDAVANESTNSDYNDVPADDNACSEKEPTSNEHNLNDDNVTEEEQKKVSDDTNEELESCELPSYNPNHYNEWIESQRQAQRMHLYKKMLRSIKTHKILKTTNLLSIKGYGNWALKNK